MTRTREAIQAFLDNRKADSPFLLDRYTVDLETQVMCDTDGQPGENPGSYTRTIKGREEVWSNKRWPYQAGTDPNYSDPPISFSPAAHVERVGTTWWDYVNERSVAVGIDIDSTDGHAETTTTNEQSDIERIIGRLEALDYVTIVRSTGGKGIHVYVFFDPNNLPASRNHHEHTLVARKTLELISQDIDFPLKDHVDCVGSVFWIWASKSPADHNGFELVKEGTYLDSGRIAGIELPQPSVRAHGNTDFEVVDLDEDHKRIIEAIAAQPYYFQVRPDMNLFHAHTCAIRDAIAAGLDVRGTFETNSNGDDPNTANCFLAPQTNGVFRVYRFGQSQHEPNWTFANGKNFCFLNDDESLQEIVSGFAEKYKSGEYLLTPGGVAELCEALGEPLDRAAPDDVRASIENGQVVLRSKKGGDGWEKEGKEHKIIVVPKRKTGSFRDRILARADDKIRYAAIDHEPLGWFHRLDNGEWMMHRSFTDISSSLDVTFKEFSKQAKDIIVSNPWQIVKVPFKDQYLSGRRWNRNAPQLAVTPADSGGDHPYFDMILEHVGMDLNEAVQNSNWCRKGNILSGADYLRCWLASLIHDTDQPLPYMFLAGPQNSGKSIFHECCRYLFNGGITSANNSLTSGFNGELEGCFLVYVEERDLADKRHNAYEKIKEWVTGRELNVRRLYQQQFTAPNYLHFVQMANNTTHLPLEDGDTRIVAIDVPALENPIPKQIMEKHLEAEASRFLRTLLNTIVPPPEDRLRIPALKTRTKELMERRSMSPVMAFAKETVYDTAGHKIQFEKFYDAFTKYCDENGTKASPSFSVYQEVMLRSDRFQLLQRNDKHYLVNATFDPKAKPKRRIVGNSSGRF
jgi:hypothetical protein